MNDVVDTVNDSYFKGSYQQAWKNIMQPGLDQAETEFIMDCCQLGESSSVLDLMCGYGRHAVELARRKVTVTGVDNLGSYVSELDTIAKTENLPIVSIHGNVRDLASMNLNLFDAVISMGNSFSFLEKTGTYSLLKNISSHLKVGGSLIINSWMITEIAIKHFQEKEWYNAGEYKCILDYKLIWNPTRIISQQFIIAPDGNTEVLEGIDYLYSLNEFSDFFKQVGLQFKAAFSTPKKRPFSIGDRQIYIHAVKI